MKEEDKELRKATLQAAIEENLKADVEEALSAEEQQQEEDPQEVLAKITEGLKDSRTANAIVPLNRTLIMQASYNSPIPKEAREKLKKIETEFDDGSRKKSKEDAQENNGFYFKLIKGICGCDGTTLKLIIALSQCLDHTNKLLGNSSTMGVSGLINSKPSAKKEIVIRETLQKGTFCYPVIKLTLRELAKMVYCGTKVGNNHLAIIMGKLKRLEKVPCRFPYKDKGEIKIKVQTLINVEYDIALNDVSVSSDTKVQNYELTIELHPLFGLVNNDVIFVRADFLSKVGNISELGCNLLALILEQMTYKQEGRPYLYKIALLNLKKRIADEDRYKKDPQRFLKDLYKAVDTLENIGLIKAKKNAKDEIIRSTASDDREGFKLTKQPNGEILCTFYFNEYYTRAAVQKTTDRN